MGEEPKLFQIQNFQKIETSSNHAHLKFFSVKNLSQELHFMLIFWL